MHRSFLRRSPPGTARWSLLALVATLAAFAFFPAVTRAQDLWLPRNSGLTTTLADVTYAAGQWIVVGQQGAILASTDGARWTPRASGTSTSLAAIAHGNGLFAAVGDLSTILTSPDGLVWTSRKRTGPRLTAIAYGNGMFLAAGETGVRWISSDGVTWFQSGISAPNSVNGIVYVAPTFVLAGERAVFTTIDAELFTRIFDSLPTICPPSLTVAVASSSLARRATSALPAPGTPAPPNQSPLARLLPTGALDASFNPATLATTALVTCLAVRPDGRILLGGSFTSVGGFPRKNFARLNPDGSLDTAFTSPANFTETAQQLLLTDDRKILVTVGSTTFANTFKLCRLSHHGALDPTFPTMSVGNGSTTAIKALRVLADGSVMVAGINDQHSYYGTPTIERFTPAGLCDATFKPQLPLLGTFTTTAAFDATGRIAWLEITVLGSEPFTFQWTKHGVPIAGHNRPFLPLIAVTRPSAGNYTVVVRNAVGVATSMTVHVGVDETSRLVILATRARVSLADGPLIAGFSVQGPGYKRLLIRGVGQTLGSAPFNVSGALAHPFLRVFNAAGTEIYANDNGAQSAAATAISTAPTRLGTFPLAGVSSDAGLLDLAPGNYTATLTGATAPNRSEVFRLAPLEIYEDDTPSSRLVNLSSRASVGTGDNVAIPGFVIAGPTPKKFLIRAVGPGLAAFGVAGTLAHPTLTLLNALGQLVAANDDWETSANLSELRAATTLLAFPLANGSRDAALLVTLNPGSYTAQVTGTNHTAGVALVEIYEVP